MLIDKWAFVGLVARRAGLVAADLAVWSLAVYGAVSLVRSALGPAVSP